MTMPSPRTTGTDRASNATSQCFSSPESGRAAAGRVGRRICQRPPGHRHRTCEEKLS